MIERWLLLVLLAGCQPGAPPLPSVVSSVEAGEFDAAPVLCQQYKRAMIRNARVVWGLDAPVAVFGAQVYQESACNPDARSPVGATGLAQFMPSTADWIDDVYPDLGQAQPANPDWALRALVRYDKHLYDQVVYDGECDRMGAALSSYNGGLGWHDKRQRIAEDPLDFWNSVRVVNPGITPANQRENEQYPVRIFNRQPQYVTWGRSVTC